MGVKLNRNHINRVVLTTHEVAPGTMIRTDRTYEVRFGDIGEKPFFKLIDAMEVAIDLEEEAKIKAEKEKRYQKYLQLKAEFEGGE